MSRLSSLSAAPHIKEYAQGAAQDAVQPVADFLAPTVPVSTLVGRYKIYTADNRFKLPDTRRAVGGRATELGWGASDGTFNCEPHALDVPVDVLEEAEGQDLESAMMEGIELAAEVGGLSHEKSVIDAALAAVAATAVDFGAGKDPVNILDGVILDVMKAARYGSLMGVRILFGATVFKGVKNHPNIRNRFVVGGDGKTGPMPLAAVGTNEVTNLLMGNPETKISFMVYDAAKEGKAADIQFVLDNKILVFACKAQPSRRDPSFMKTFRLRNKFMVPGTYMRDDQRVEVAKFDWSEDVKVTNSAAAVVLQPTF